MIRNNLAALMGERGLKITRVAKETGISRNTITSISQNDSEMIRTDTINTLCKYLGVTPCEFYEYEPIDLEFTVYINEFKYLLMEESIPNFSGTVFTVSEFESDVILDVISSTGKKSFDLKCNSPEYQKMEKDIFSTDNVFQLQLQINFENSSDEKTFVEDIYKKINTAFHQDIYKKMTDHVLSEIKNTLLADVANSEDSLQDKQTFEKLIKNELKIIINSEVFKKF